MPIEEVAGQGPGRCGTASRLRLIELSLRELSLYSAKLQCRPHYFANFFSQPETGRIVLLDFGATG